MQAAIECLRYLGDEKIISKNLPGTPGTPALEGPLDFVHHAHPVVTPLVVAAMRASG